MPTLTQKHRVLPLGFGTALQIALVDIRGRVNKEREEGSDFFSTVYEGLKHDYLEAHIPGAVFVDWTKARLNGGFGCFA